MMRLKSFVAGIAFFMFSQLVFASGPVGEEAAYQLDNARSRTSTLIRSGTFNTKVTAHLPDHPEGESYNVHFIYDLDVMFYGRQQGEGNAALAAEIFSPSYMERLRSEGQIDTPQYTIKHIGIESVSTRDGLSVENADIVELTNINLENSGILVKWVKAILKSTAKAIDPDSDGEQSVASFENVKIKAAIKRSAVPVIGAIKADLSATYSGIFIKAGFDYVSQ